MTPHVAASRPLGKRQQARYRIFTFAFIGIVAALILTGQFVALALILIGFLVYAPVIVRAVTGDE